MPYSYHKKGDQYIVTKKDTGKEVGRTKGTKEALNKYLAALHINANENKTMKKSELTKMIQEVIKEVISEKNTIKIGDIVSKKYASTDEDYTKEFKVIDITGMKATLQDTSTGKKTGIALSDLTKIPMKEATTDYMKRRQAQDDYATNKKDAPKKQSKMPASTGKTDYMKRREAEKKMQEAAPAKDKDGSAAFDTAVAFRLVAKGNRDEAFAELQKDINKNKNASNGKFSKVKETIILSKGNPQDIILKLNGPSAFSMGTNTITAKDKNKEYINPVIRNNFSKISPYTPKLTKI